MYKTSVLIISIFSVITLANCSSRPTLEQLKIFAATETFPEDVFLDTVANKKALVIVAHDDDDCAMSGTIAKLTANGWKIKQLSLVEHKNEKAGKNSSHIICEGNQPILEDGIYRPGVDTMKNPYFPIPNAEIKKQFLWDKVETALAEEINAFQPSVVFTLDNIKGGYGHPEHIFVSQAVLNLFEQGKIHCQRIYQSVYTNHMEHEIVDVWLNERLKNWGFPNASLMANELYGIDGMPEPDVQVNITGYAETKMKYLRDYPESVRQNLRKFIPYYEEFDAQAYFAIFDREFFRVVEN